MISLFSIIITVLLFSFVGYPFTKLAKNATLTGRLSLAFILGSMLTTFAWFLSYLLHFPLTLTSLLISSIFCFILGLLITRNHTSSAKFSLKNLNRLDRYLLLTLITVFLLALIAAVYNPITSWDSLTLYDFRAIVISQSHSLVEIESNTYHLSYPLMTSLMHSVVYMLKGSTPQPLYSLLYLALIGVIYDYLYINTNRRSSLFASLLTATNPFMWEHATITYSNLPYTAVYLSGILTSFSSPILAGLLIGFSSWVRLSEPFWILGIILILILHWKKNKLQSVIGVLLILSIRYSWQLYHQAAYLRSGLESASASSIYNLEIFAKIASNLNTITDYLSQFILIPYLGIWLLIIASIISRPTRSKSLIYLLVSIILILGMVVAGTSIFSTYYSSWYSIGGSATRMAMIFVPLGIVAGVQSHYLLRSKNAKK